MQLRALPPEIIGLLKENNAPPRLVAHLRVVHDTVCELVARLEQSWPGLVYDREVVLVGAALHDIGKVRYPKELVDDGNAHEAAGEQLLLEQGWPAKYARFARTHGQWQIAPDVILEDLLVALADKIWKGKRDEAIEDALSRMISKLLGMEIWDVYLKIDEIASVLSEDAHERILWQGQQSI